MWLNLNKFHLTVIHTKGSSVNPSLIITLLIHYFDNIQCVLTIVFTFHHKYVSFFTYDDKLRDFYECPNDVFTIFNQSSPASYCEYTGDCR